jgi:hypothetical protein
MQTRRAKSVVRLGEWAVALGFVFALHAQTPGNLVALSARVRVAAGGNPIIGGFVVQGTGSQHVLVRAMGPGLATLKVAGAMTNPKLTVFNAAGAMIAANDDWESVAGGIAVKDAVAKTGASPFAVGSRDAAAVVEFSPGAYTVHVASADGESGVALIELYSVSGGSARLTALSVRGTAGTGSDTLIAGFVVSGGSRSLLVRGAGPALAAWGVSGAIADPRLMLYDVAGAKRGENDNWSAASNPAALADAAAQTGAAAFSAGSADAAMLVTAQSTAYTAHITDNASRSGEALVEVYALTGSTMVKQQLEESWNRGIMTNRGAVKLTAAPMKPADVSSFQPLGLTAGAHVTPVDHCYFYPADITLPRAAYEVYAPGDGRITMIQHRTALAGTTETQRTYDDYRVMIAHSATYFSYYDLIDVIDPALVAQIPGGLVMGGTTICNVPVTAGQVVGRIGKRSLDFAVVDTEKPLPGFVNPEHYLLEPWKIFTQDPVEAFAEPARSQILSRGSRAAVPLGGKIDYDIAGRLVGSWFREGTNGYSGNGDPRGYWIGHFAIFPHFLDPSITVISFGDYNGQGPKFFAAKAGSRDPAGVARSDGPVKYEFIDFIRPSSATPLAGASGVVVGTVLFEVLDGDRLRIEQFPGKTAADVGGFTAAAQIYER